MRWFTSDLHFGHTNVIRYCDRPFASVGEMDAALAGAWNTVVAPEDEVWVLGDLAMGRIAESLPLAGKLAGRKHLVLGNHDRPFEPGRRRDNWSDRYLDEGGFEQLHDGVVELRLTDGTEVLACHFPYEGDSGDRDRFVAARPRDEGKWLLHGHVHEVWRQNGRMINVGVDAWAGAPVSEDRLVELIAAGPTERSPLPWESTTR